MTANFTESQTFTGNLNSKTASVANGVTVTAAAADLTGDTVAAAGNGNIAITALHSTTNANLSGLSSGSGAVTAAFDGSATFAGNLGSAVVTVADSVTMTAAANVVASKTVNKASSGALAVRIGAADSSVNLTTIQGTAFSSVTVFEDVTFTGSLDETIATSVDAGAKLTIAAGSVTTKTVTGNGSITVTAVDTSTNLANVNASLTHVANLKTGADISSNSNLGTVDNFNLENNAEVTMTKVQHADLTVGSAGVGSSNKITMSGAASFNAESTVETYQLDNTTNSITLSSNAHTVIGGTGVDTILGGSGADTIDGGTGLDKLSGGGDDDDFLYSAGDAYTDVNSSSIFETISDFTTGSDDIDIVGATVNSLTTFNGINLVSNKFDDALRGERNEDGGVVGSPTSNFTNGDVDAFFMYNVAGTGVGYLAVDMNASGTLDSNDVVILLSNGDQASDLVFADFI